MWNILVLFKQSGHKQQATYLQHREGAHLHSGSRSYICKDEGALLSSLSGTQLGGHVASVKDVTSSYSFSFFYFLNFRGIYKCHLRES